jgi:Protein of unknown function (DUF3822)
MAKILFDIAGSQEQIDWSRSRLVMEISQRIFSFAVVDADRTITQLRMYELYGNSSTELAEELERIIAEDDILQLRPHDCTFVYNFPESQLVPEACFDTVASPQLIELMHGDLTKGIVLSEKIKDSTRYNVFRVPAAVHQLLQTRFASGVYWHYYSLLLSQNPQQAPASPNHLAVIFYPNRILVAAVKDRQLHLLQSYLYEAAEDAAYYLLNICAQLQLPPMETPLLLSGMIDVHSVLYTEIYKYFTLIELEQPQGLPAAASLDNFPPHFFSPLLKLALCVS